MNWDELDWYGSSEIVNDATQHGNNKTMMPNMVAYDVVVYLRSDIQPREHRKRTVRRYRYVRTECSFDYASADFDADLMEGYGLKMSLYNGADAHEEDEDGNEADEQFVVPRSKCGKVYRIQVAVEANE